MSEVFYDDVSLSGNQLAEAQLVDVSIETLETLPSSADEGRIVLFNNKFHIYSGNEWKEIVDNNELTRQIESAKQGLAPKAAVDYTTWVNVDIREEYRNISRPLSSDEVAKNVPNYIVINEPENTIYYNIDHRGVGINAGDRILLKNQTNKKQNGIYIVEGSPSLGGYRLVRAYDLDNGDPADNVYLFVKKGTTGIHEDVAFVQTNNETSVGISELQFNQFSSGAAQDLKGSDNIEIIDKKIQIVTEGENAVALKKDVDKNSNIVKDSIELIRIKDAILSDINSLGLPIIAEGIYNLSEFNDRHVQFNFLMNNCFSKILNRVSTESGKILNSSLETIKTMDDEIYSNIFDAIKVSSLQSFEMVQEDGVWVNNNIAVVPYVTDEVRYPFWEHKLDESGNPLWIDEENNIPVYNEKLDQDGNPVLDEDGNPVYNLAYSAYYPAYLNYNTNSGEDPKMKFVLTFCLDSNNIFKDILNEGISLLEKNSKIESWAKYVFLDILIQEHGSDPIYRFLEEEGVEGNLSPEHIEYAHQLSLEHLINDVIVLFSQKYLQDYVSPTNLLN